MPAIVNGSLRRPGNLPSASSFGAGAVTCRVPGAHLGPSKIGRVRRWG
jgi:hypothetical protein